MILPINWSYLRLRVDLIKDLQLDLPFKLKGNFYLWKSIEVKRLSILLFCQFIGWNSFWKWLNIQEISMKLISLNIQVESIASWNCQNTNCLWSKKLNSTKTWKFEKPSTIQQSLMLRSRFLLIYQLDHVDQMHYFYYFNMQFADIKR